MSAKVSSVVNCLENEPGDRRRSVTSPCTGDDNPKPNDSASCDVDVTPADGEVQIRHGRTYRRRHLGPLPAAILASTVTIVLTYLLSSGLRSDLGEFAATLGGFDTVGLRDWILSFGVFSPLIYFLIVVGQVVANPVPAGPVTLAGALVFGVVPGLVLSMAGSVLGSALVFLAVRKWGTPLVVRLVGKEHFHKYAGRLDEKGWWVFLILLFPFMPDDAVCALAGLSAVPFGRFLVVMVVGRLPGTTMTALLASDVVTGSVAAWITVGLIAAVVLALGIIYRERLESWLLHRTDER